MSDNTGISDVQTGTHLLLMQTVADLVTATSRQSQGLAHAMQPPYSEERCSPKAGAHFITRPNVGHTGCREACFRDLNQGGDMIGGCAIM